MHIFFASEKILVQKENRSNTELKSVLIYQEIWIQSRNSENTNTVEDLRVFLYK